MFSHWQARKAAWRRSGRSTSTLSAPIPLFGCAARWSSLPNQSGHYKTRDSDNGHDDRAQEASTTGSGSKAGDDEEDGDIEPLSDTATPPPLDESIVHRTLDILKTFLEPIPDDYVLPPQTLLGHVSSQSVPIPRAQAHQSADAALDTHLAELDTYARFGLKIVTIISNNYAWGMSQAGQDLIYGEKTPVRQAALEMV